MDTVSWSSIAAKALTTCPIGTLLLGDVMLGGGAGMSVSASLHSAGVCMVHMACLTHQWYVLVFTPLVLDAPDAGGNLFQSHFSASAASALSFLIFWSF